VKVVGGCVNLPKGSRQCEKSSILNQLLVDEASFFYRTVGRLPPGRSRQKGFWVGVKGA
jgi:hypothetical protein